MLEFLGAFGPIDESTAILKIAGIACWVIAAFVTVPARMRSGGTGLIALGLALFFFNEMWTTVEAAF